jgi:hypothetical protein
MIAMSEPAANVHRSSGETSALRRRMLFAEKLRNAAFRRRSATNRLWPTVTAGAACSEPAKRASARLSKPPFAQP